MNGKKSPYEAIKKYREPTIKKHRNQLGKYGKENRTKIE